MCVGMLIPIHQFTEMGISMFSRLGNNTKQP